jgi:hypothetical protein
MDMFYQELGRWVHLFTILLSFLVVHIFPSMVTPLGDALGFSVNLLTEHSKSSVQVMSNEPGISRSKTG